MYGVDLYRRVRLACHREGLSRREASRQFGIDRKTVAKILLHSEPPGYRRREPPKRPKLAPFTAIIDRILEEDRTVHRKQRHTAKRIFERLRDEHGFTGKQTIVKDYHLVVSNSRPWARARNVNPLLIRVERPGPDGEWQQTLFSGPLFLHWQFGLHIPIQPVIGRDHLCDLGRITEEGGVELVTVIRPNNFDPTLPAGGKLRAHVQAVADNGDSKAIVVEISWDGMWAIGSDEMHGHLIVKEVKGTK
mgnify:CR=1 FL=1